MCADNRRPNWLLWGLVIVSVGVHLLIYARISKFYTKNQMTYIELSLSHSVTERPKRDIPVPPVHKPPSLTTVLPKRPRIVKPKVPSMVPARANPVSVPVTADSAVAAPLPKLAAFSAPGVVHVDPRAFATPSVEFDSRGAYLGMVRHQIEEHKVYPDSAQKRHFEGRVTVGFVLTPEGRIKDIDIVNYAPYQALNEAALKAVKTAGPFPPPPPGFFKGDLHLRVVIVFKLI